MFRFAFALVAAFVLTSAVCAADLPAGTWAVNVDGNKGDLIIKEVKDGKVTGVLIDTDFTGTWDGKELKFQSGEQIFEAQLVTEPGDKGKTKYTLTGTRSMIRETRNRATPGIHVVKNGGWYAQISAEAPVTLGEIKAEIRGVLVESGADVYVSVKHKDSHGDVKETRIWVWKSEGEWKLLQQTLKPLYGKEIVVTSKLAQMPKGTSTSIPEGALYFLGKFEPKLANQPK